MTIDGKRKLPSATFILFPESFRFGKTSKTETVRCQFWQMTYTDVVNGSSSNCYIWHFNIAYVGSIQETTVLAAQIVKSETYYKVVPQWNDGTPTFIFLFAASREEKWITVPYTHTSSFVSEKPVWNSLIGDAAALHNVTYCSVSIPLPATAQPNRKRSVLNECVYPARFLGRRRWPNSWRTTVVVV